MGMGVCVLAVDTEITACLIRQYTGILQRLESDQRTKGHEVVSLQDLLNTREERHRGRVQHHTVTSQITYTGRMIEVVSQRDAISLSYLKNFVFAVTIESCPLNGRFGLAINSNAPIKRVGVLGVAHDQLASLVIVRQGDYKRSELAGGTWGINVRLEEARWSSVDLAFRQLND
jgi:hypothetical protein